MFRDALFLALRYLRASPWRSIVLVAGMAIALFLPVFTWLAGQEIESSLLSRARSTPLVVGAKGNEFDLTMSSLYFRGQVGEDIVYGERGRLEKRGSGVVIPVYVRFASGGVPIVGTVPEYFEQRGLAFADGRRPVLLGEVVAGAGVAQDLGLSSGSTVRSDLTNLYNLAGAYPALLEVVGILERSQSPDDDVFFADLKTAWLLEGRFHGHDQITPEAALNPETARSPGAAEADNLEASAAVFLFQRINRQNREAFHMHGSRESAPVGSLLVFPRDQRAHDQLLGDMALDERLQAVRPEEVVRVVLGVVLRAQEALSGYFVLIAASTVAFFGLVISLSLRLRHLELELMKRMGCARGTVAMMVGAELLLVGLASAAVAAGMAAIALAWLQQVARLSG